MRKIIVLILAVCMSFMESLPAFAEIWNAVSRPVSVSAVLLPSGTPLVSRPVSVSAVLLPYGTPLVSRPVSVSTIGAFFPNTPLYGYPVSTAAIDPGYIGLYKMDNDWSDSSGNGYHGTAVSGPSFSTDAKIGTHSGSFDTENGHIDLGSMPAIENLSEFTVAAWVKFSNSPSATEGILTKSLSSSTGLELYRSDTGGIGFTPDGIGRRSSNTQITDNDWHHVVGVFKAGTNVDIYIDGLLDNGSLSGSIPSATHGGSTTLKIGKRYSSSECIRGFIDDLHIYQRALTAQEISLKYSIGSGLFMPTVQPVNSPTASASVTLQGTREANTSVLINGIIVVPIDSSTTWQYQYTLAPGVNNLSIASRMASGLQSQPVNLSITYDNAAPVIAESTPANNGYYNSQISSLTIRLGDAYSPIDLNGTLTGASVTNALGQNVAGAWSTSGADTIIFTPENALAESTYTVSINPVDSLGNAASAQIVFTYDISAPPAPAVTAFISPTNQTAQAISGTRSTDTASITAVSSTASFGAKTYPAADRWTLQVTGLSQGMNAIELYALDAAGNSSQPTVINIELDTTPPAQPSIDAYSSMVTTNSVTLSGAKEANSYLTINGVQTPVPFESSVWSHTVQLAEGVNTLNIAARDAIGNQSQPVAVSITRDTTAPHISSSVPSANAHLNQAGSIEITLSDVHSLVDLQASLAGASVQNSLGAQVPGSWSLSDGKLVFTPSGSLTDSVYTVIVHPVDSLGNTGQASFSFTLDAVAPAAVSLSMSPSSPHRAESVTFTINFNEDMLTGVQPSVTFSKGFLYGSHNVSGSWLNNRNWRGNFAFTSNTGDGTYTVKIESARDLAQNVSPSQEIGTFVLDTAAPASPVVSTVTTPTKNAYQTLSGSKEPNTAIFINNVQRVALNSSDAWTYNMPLSEGNNSINVVARDEAGNNSSPASVSIVLDTTPPAFAITSYQNPSPSETQEISGTKEPGAVIKLNNVVIIDSSDTNPTWAHTVTLTDGITNRLTFVATDALGNSITKAIDILYDTAAPDPMPAGVLTADGGGKGTEVSLSWQAFIEQQDLAYYRIYYSASDFDSVSGLTPAGTVNKGTRSFKVTGLVQGTQYYFAVVPVDASGNYSAAVIAVAAVPADTAAPEEVSGLSAQVGYDATNQNFITITWTPSANSAGDLSDQAVYFDDGSGYDSGTPLGSAATSYAKNGLSDAAKYKFRVTTKDSGGHESAGAVAEAVTRLNNPAGLAAAPGKNKITLSWSPVNSAYVKEYRVYRAESGSQINDISGMTFVKALSGTSYIDTGLVNGTTYQYAVTVLNTSGAERTSVESISAAPREDEIGPAVSGLSLAANQVVAAPLTISASAQDAESQMDRLELYIDSALVKTQSGSGISHYWNILDSEDGNHSVKIIAYDSLGNSTTVTVPVIVSAAHPSTPVVSGHSVVQTAPEYLVNVNGTAPLHTTITLKLNGTAIAEAAADGSGAFSFNSVELTEGDNLVSVKAAHRGGESVFSPDYVIVVDTGAPNAPLNLSAKASSGGKVQLAWQNGTGELPSGYNIYAASEEFEHRNDPGVVKVNAGSVAYQFNEFTPQDDSLRYYGVTAIDSSGNESGLSNIVSIASDRSLPAIAAIRFTYTDQPGNLADPADTAGPGTIKVFVESTEPLSELPFFSLEPQSGSPIVFTMKKIDGTHYEGALAVNALTPHGQTTYKFSGKDMVGNRGNSQANGISIDVRGPAASITSPASVAQIAPSVNVSVTFDEAPVNTPVLLIRDINGAEAPVTGLTTSNNLVWTGTADISALAEGTAQFILNEVRDGFGNGSTAIVSGASILLYSSAVPAPPIPGNLNASPKKGRGVELSWSQVDGAESYRIYRRADGEPTPVLIATAGQSAASYTDTAPADGLYHYSISSVGLLESESQKSAEAAVAADGTAPSAPAGLSLVLGGSGMTAAWTAPSGETPASYRLYRSNAEIVSTTGLNPVAGSTGLSATDPAPTSSARTYAVTALDALGNESSPSASMELAFPVAPAKDLVLSRIDNGKPTLTWSASEANLQGYHIYRNGSRITQSPTPTASYTDNYYSGGAVTYGVSQVDSLGNESPVKEVALPEINIGLREGTALRRGLIETVPVVLSSPAGLMVSSIEISVGSSPSSSLAGPFTLTPDAGLTVEKVAAADLNAASQIAVYTTAVISPAPGTTVRVTKTSLANVLGSGTALEIFNDPLVKSGQARVRLKVNNIGSARMEFLTSQNNGPTTQVKIMLKDQDGNMLGQGYLNQRTGKVINSGSYAFARLNPGENMITDPITFDIPASAPYKVKLEAEIQNTYYNYNQSDMVVAPGLKQSIETTISTTSYNATASVAGSVYKQGESVVITGQAISSTAGSPMPLVPVKIGISVKGFDRFYTVSTDDQGSYSYTFKPGVNEAGTFSVWAVHPDISDRTVQAQFIITGIEMSPTSANLKMVKNSSYDIPVTIKNLGDTELSGLSFTTTSSTGITSAAVNGGSTVLAPNETRNFKLRVTAAATAPDLGYTTLVVSAYTPAGQGDVVSSTLDANITLAKAIPVIKTSPSYIDTGIVKGNQKIGTFTISNTGLDTLKNARLEGPSLPWLSLTVDKAIGDIQPGSSKSIGVLIRPGEAISQGIYDDRIVVYSDNHIPYTYNIQVTVTSTAVGSLLFDVLNELMEDVGNASITLQHQTVPDLFYTIKTGADGTVSIYDIPEGRYTFNISATGHKPYSGSITVVPGLTVAVPVALESSLIDIEWSVVPITIEDRYEIRISQTFQTNVPTSVLVVEPAGITLPDMQPGEVFNGEFTITNYGLIAATYQGMNIPSIEGYDVEVLATIPATIGAMQKVTVPYRITKRAE